MTGRGGAGWPATGVQTPDGPVTLANWQDAPFNRWSFQHVQQLVPCARVDRGEGPVLELPPDPRSLDDAPVALQDGTATTLGDYLDGACTDGFLVLRRGRLVMERYFNGMTSRTPHLLQSVSKSVCGTVGAVLFDDGALRPEDRITDHVAELRSTSFEGATVRHLLDMTAGTRFSEDYDDPSSDVRAFEAAAGWQPPSPREMDLDLPGYMARLPNARDHGELFEYRSILSDALGLALERAGRVPFAELTSRLLWRHIGAEHDAWLTVDRHGNPMTDGGYCVTLRDLARLGQLYAQGGCVLGRQVLPAAWIRDTRFADEECLRAFHASPDASALCSPTHQACRPTGHYRNQWWVLDPARGVLLGSGIYGQNLYVDLTADVVIVKLSSLPAPLDMAASADGLAAFAAVTAALEAAGD